MNMSTFSNTPLLPTKKTYTKLKKQKTNLVVVVVVLLTTSSPSKSRLSPKKNSRYNATNVKINF